MESNNKKVRFDDFVSCDPNDLFMPPDSNFAILLKAKHLVNP